MGIVLKDVSPRDITVASVCIVRFNCPIGPSDVKAGLFFQVTVDPDTVEGDFIRFGASGDELVGWQPLDFIRVCHVLAIKRIEKDADGKEVVTFDAVERDELGITIT